MVGTNFNEQTAERVHYDDKWEDMLRKTLLEAQRLHHDYETNTLKGVRDANWHGAYAMFMKGRLPQLADTPTSALATILNETQGEDWAAEAAKNIVEKMPPAKIINPQHVFRVDDFLSGPDPSKPR